MKSQIGIRDGSPASVSTVRPAVSKLMGLVLSVLAFSAVAGADTPTELFFSEYVEGSSFNKALEIYNGTGAAIDLGLGDYEIEIYFNGSTSPGTTVDLVGSVAPGDVFVVADDGADASVLAETDQTSSSSFFNGDDAVLLRRAGVIIDSLGQTGTDPGSQWGSGDTSTQDNTLRRKPEICQGDPNDTDVFDPAAEWIGFPQNAFDGLGSHSVDCAAGPVVPDLLLTELVVTPTAAEFIEIYNPTGSALDLSNVFLTDATFAGGGTFYYNIVTGANAGGGSFSDFHARFPAGATILPGEYQVVSLNGSTGFSATFGFAPDYELFEDDAAPDGVPDMLEALPGSINGQGGLTNSGEVVVLYFWDDESDLVIDLDYGLWGDKDEAVDKTGVSIDGPDPDSDTSTYLPDTAILLQDVIDSGGHASGASFQRFDFSEGTETQTGGNGRGGSDETSENLSETWASDTPSPGAAPPDPPVDDSWIINEVHADPDAALGDANGDGTVSTTQDEFVEIINNSGAPADISGWTLSDGVQVRHTFPEGTMVADQCGVVVFGGGTPTGSFGNVVVQTASTGSLGLNNSGDTITLSSGASSVATVSYGSEGGDNQSLTRDPDVSGSLPLVRHTTATGSGGALYSPGTRVDGTFFSGCPAAPSGWIINEIHADPDANLGDANGDGTVSTTQDEFIELVNATGGDVDISGWSILDGVGLRHTFPSGTVVADQCGVVVFGGGAPTGLFGGMTAQTASTGSLGLNNSGDTVTLNDGVTDLASVIYGSEGGDNQSLTRDPDLSGDFVKHSVATGSGGALFSPGTLVDGSQFSGCDVITPTLEIYEIQGNGESSPVEGLIVTTLANVVTALGTDGFFMQTPTERSDGDVDTSDGIFVFQDAAPTVAAGDLVDVTGQVAEFFGFTEFAAGSSVTVVGTGTLPAPVVFDASTPSPDPEIPSCAIEFECYESMLIEVGSGAVTGPNQRFGSDPIAEVFITAAPERTFREPGIEFPGLPTLPVWDGNPEVFELDPDKLGLPNQIIPAGSTFSAQGVLGFEFGGYELWPVELTVDERMLPIPVRPRDFDEFTIGSLNMFRLFDDIDDPADVRSDGEVRDDEVVSTEEYLRRREKLVQYILDVLRAPDVLAVQEVEKLGVLEDLAEDIAIAEPSVVYTPYLVEGNDRGTIDIGFMVRRSITVDEVVQLGKDETYVNPITGLEDILHDRPPLRLKGSYLDQSPFEVFGVHMRSLGGIDGSEGERVRQKRFEQANSVAEKVQALQSDSPMARIVVTGDFNAFEFSDGYVDLVGQIVGDFVPGENLICDTNDCDDLVDPNLSNRVLALEQDDRYSFIFRGSAQILDHVLVSEMMDPFVNDLQYGRGNADAAVDLINGGSTPLRSSDHDGLVLYLHADGDLDGVTDAIDVCPATMIPEQVPTVRLGFFRWALVDDDLEFDTRIFGWGLGGTAPGAAAPTTENFLPSLGFTTEDTAGCSCEQIIEALNLGPLHTKFGCGTLAMKFWVRKVNP